MLTGSSGYPQKEADCSSRSTVTCERGLRGIVGRVNDSAQLAAIEAMIKELERRARNMDDRGAAD
jgi:hypothetical protein